MFYVNKDFATSSSYSSSTFQIQEQTMIAIRKYFKNFSLKKEKSLIIQVLFWSFDTK
jgi:hypothetical protein